MSESFIIQTAKDYCVDVDTVKDVLKKFDNDSEKMYEELEYKSKIDKIKNIKGNKMTEKTITKTIYISNDGKEFENKDSCLNYENIFSNLPVIKEEINQWFKNNGLDCYTVVKIEITNNEVEISLIDNDIGIEPDEDFNADYDEWGKFLKSLKEKYNLTFRIPYYYWGK